MNEFQEQIQRGQAAGVSQQEGAIAGGLTSIGWPVPVPNCVKKLAEAAQCADSSGMGGMAATPNHNPTVRKHLVGIRESARQNMIKAREEFHEVASRVDRINSAATFADLAVEDLAWILQTAQNLTRPERY